MNGLQIVIKLNGKVIKVDYFCGAAVMIFSHQLFLP